MPALLHAGIHPKHVHTSLGRYTTQAGTPPGVHSPGRYTPQHVHTPGRYTPQTGTPLGRYIPQAGTPPGRYTSPVGTPPIRTVHAGIRSTSGRYASHWNAILLVSTYVVCERLSVMHEPAGVVENLVQILQNTPIL